MRHHLPLFACVLALGLLPASLRADEPAAPLPPLPPQAPAAPAAPVAVPRASDEEAAAAVARFKEDWKAKGLKGEERLMQRDFALSTLAKVQHPSVVAELGSVAKSGDDALRTLAVIYLGDQKACAALAGEHVLGAMQRNGKDTVLVLSGLESLGGLRYLGGGDVLKGLLKSEDYSVRKYTITTVGVVGDMRLLDELLKILGVDPKVDPTTAPEPASEGATVVEEGYSWDGAEASHDTGTAGDGDQKEAERKGKEQLAKNKAAAQGGSGGGGGAGGIAGAGDSGGSGGRGGSARSTDDLKPFVLRALKSLTGQTFMATREIRAWLAANGDKVVAGKQRSADAEKAQKALSKA